MERRWAGRSQSLLEFSAAQHEAVFLQVQLGAGDSADGVCELIEVFGLELEGVSDEGTILAGKQSLRKTGDFFAA